MMGRRVDWAAAGGLLSPSAPPRARQGYAALLRRQAAPAAALTEVHGPDACEWEVDVHLGQRRSWGRLPAQQRRGESSPPAAAQSTRRPIISAGPRRDDT
eukprot:gene1501-34646_t